MHALIIEDEPLVAMMIENALLDLGFTSIAIAATEQEAIAATKARRPDLITSDVVLATGNGIDAIQAICRDRTIPVVFVTGSADQVTSRDATAVVVPKPFRISDLVDGIGKARERLPAAEP